MQYLSQIPNFGFAREGDGKVVYILSRELAIGEFNVIEKIANQSLGQGRWSEYDPSIVETSNYVIEDEQNIYELLSINKSSDALVRSFFIEILTKNIRLILINFEKETISVIDDIDDRFIKNIDKNSYVFAREYDYIEDY
ncbi:hypothetical protein OAI17_05060 [Gammaproteobacteria bacterium]|jgi:hypothetical protein|nr:hypothetical protein [Gammaproteobacteria bacterium]MDA8808399.1 hypothetical protein [Gammaproteobacteria bacterium]MDA8907945.1 hypothetical protein [Gammaproteobacteria bacterium]MDA8935300.1 hypothetical protein [Gammaproteobacteria bacterium]MDA9147436.1 hypothetical protein [Gammaproteobacteria bacterium]